MKTKFLLPLLTLLLSLLFITKLNAQVKTSDSLALVDLYNSTSGPNWKSHTNWLTTQPVSTWYGVMVRNTRVVSIVMSYNRMSGTLPASIGNLDSLQTLSITNNYTSLTGAIPSSIGNLHRLITLDLNTNGFTGSIPYSIGSTDSLQTLNLSNNSLSGTIPLSMSKLKKLASFDASYNLAGLGHISGDGISGAIPDSLGFCPALTLINLGYNSLTGNIPSSFQNLTHLTRLELFTNKLSGTFTNVFSTNSQLVYLNLTANQFSGNVPSFFSQLTHLSTLLLAGNLFSGTIPVDLASASSLVILDLSSNQLSGTIPAKLNNLPVLTNLNLSSNKLTGQLPFLLHNYSIQNPNLNVSNNKLTTTRNPQWSGAKQPGVFNFGSNRFTFNGLEYFNEKYYTVNDAPQAQIKIEHIDNELRADAGGSPKYNLYSWYKVGNPNPTQFIGTTDYHPLSSGKYYVTVTSSVVTDLTLMSDTVNYTYGVSAITASAQPSISFYPNPVKSVISITGLNEKMNVKITVADMSGYVWTTGLSHQQSVIKMNVGNLKAGNYLVSISDGNEIKTVQFVKE